MLYTTQSHHITFPRGSRTRTIKYLCAARAALASAELSQPYPSNLDQDEYGPCDLYSTRYMVTPHANNPPKHHHLSAKNATICSAPACINKVENNFSCEWCHSIRTGPKIKTSHGSSPNEIRQSLHHSLGYFLEQNKCTYA